MQSVLADGNSEVQLRYKQEPKNIEKYLYDTYKGESQVLKWNCTKITLPRGKLTGRRTTKLRNIKPQKLSLCILAKLQEIPGRKKKQKSYEILKTEYRMRRFKIYP